MYYSSNSVSRRAYFSDSLYYEDQDYLTPARPASITAVCGLLAVSLAYSLYQLPGYMNTAAPLPLWFWVYAAFSLGMTGGAIAGLWRMKAGGAILFSASYVLSILVAVLAHITVDISFLVIPLVIQIIIYRKFDLME